MGHSTRRRKHCTTRKRPTRKAPARLTGRNRGHIESRKTAVQTQSQLQGNQVLRDIASRAWRFAISPTTQSWVRMVINIILVRWKLDSW